MSLLATIKNILGFKSDSPTLGAGDRYLVCIDCLNKFVFDSGEQKFFKSKGFTDPKRCPTCRKKVKGQMRKKFRPRGARPFFSRKDSLIDGRSPYADER